MHARLCKHKHGRVGADTCQGLLERLPFSQTDREPFLARHDLVEKFVYVVVAHVDTQNSLVDACVDVAAEMTKVLNWVAAFWFLA